jgi:hypothetical protein
MFDGPRAGINYFRHKKDLLLLLTVQAPSLGHLIYTILNKAGSLSEKNAYSVSMSTKKFATL